MSTCLLLCAINKGGKQKIWLKLWQTKYFPRIFWRNKMESLMSSIVLPGLGMWANSCRTFLARRWRSCLGSTTPGGWGRPGGKGETRPGDMRGGVTPASLSPSTPSSVSRSSSLAWAGRARGGCHHEGRGGTLGVSGVPGANTSSDRLRLALGQLWSSPSSSSPTSSSSWLLLLLRGPGAGCLSAQSDCHCFLC